MEAVILTDDYFFLQGGLALLNNIRSVSVDGYFFSTSTSLMSPELGKLVEGKPGAAYIIAIDNDALRSEISRLLTDIAGRICLVFDFPLGLIDEWTNGMVVFSKKSNAHFFLKWLEEAAERSRPGSRSCNALRLRVSRTDSDIFMYSTSGVKPDTVAAHVGINSKRVYSRRQSFLEKNGFSRTSAYSILLMKRIIDSGFLRIDLSRNYYEH